MNFIVKTNKMSVESSMNMQSQSQNDPLKAYLEAEIHAPSLATILSILPDTPATILSMVLCFTLPQALIMVSLKPSGVRALCPFNSCISWPHTNSIALMSQLCGGKDSRMGIPKVFIAAVEAFEVCCLARSRMR